MNPIAAPAPARPAPAVQLKAADTDDRFAAMVDRQDDDAPPADDTPVNDSAAKDAPVAKPAQAATPQATGTVTLAALIAAANGEAAPPAPAPAPAVGAAPAAKPEGDAPADPKAEAKPIDKDAPTPAPVLPGTAPVLSPTPPPLAPAPHLAAPAAKAAPKDEKATTATATEAKPVHAALAAVEAPAAAPAKAEAAPAGAFKAALDGVAATPQAHTAATAPVTPDAPVVSARPGQIGAETGIQIARQINAGENEFLLRLNPAEHGHIQIHMRFEEDGALRAVISADSATVLDMLRKDSGDLTRALGDAGVRTDAQSFRFHGQGQGQDGQRQPRGHQQGWAAATAGEPQDDIAAFRPLRTGLGVLDRLA